MSPTPTTSSSAAKPVIKSPIAEKARKAALAEIDKRLNEPTPNPAPTPNRSPKRRDGAKGTPKDATKGARSAHGPTSAPKGGKTKPAPTAKPAKMGGLDAAAKVLAESKKPMRAIDMYAEIEKRGLWKTLGKTPEATIYAAIIREIAAKGKDARFKKTDRGMFIATGKGN